MSSICTASFACYIAATDLGLPVGLRPDDPDAEGITCKLELDAPQTVVVRGNELPGGFIKDFTYYVGSDPDRSHPSYGFRLAFSGPAEPAVTAKYNFAPTTPRLETPNQPLKMQNGRLNVQSISINEARAAALDNPKSVNINLTIFMNTGF